MSNVKFKVRVINKTKPDQAAKFFNWDIANSAYAKNAGWTIEDPELNEKLIANGHDPLPEAPKVEAPKEEKKETPKEQPKEEKKEEAKEKSTSDQVKEELEEEEVIDYNKLSWSELKDAAKDKGINTHGKKKVDIISELKDN